MQSAIDGNSYRREGFLVLPRLFDAAEMDALRDDVTGLCRGEFGQIEGLDPVPSGLTDAEIRRRYIGCHVVHKALPRARRLLADSRIVDVVSQLIGPNVKFIHSVLFIKGPGQPGNAWHQDQLFIPTGDRSLTTVWIAIDDARVGNGCLRIIPGAHGRGAGGAVDGPGVLWPMRRHNDPDLDRAEEAYGFTPGEEAAVPIELSAGSAVVFDGYALHGSYPNKTETHFRHSIQFVYMRAESLLPWDQVGRAPTGDDYRDIIMVAGEDPYAYKGITDLSAPYMRHPGPTVADLRDADKQTPRHGCPVEGGPVRERAATGDRRLLPIR